MTKSYTNRDGFEIKVGDWVETQAVHIPRSELADGDDGYRRAKVVDIAQSANGGTGYPDVRFNDGQWYKVDPDACRPAKPITDMLAEIKAIEADAADHDEGAKAVLSVIDAKPAQDVAADRDVVHLSTGSSSVRCGAPVSPYYADGIWKYDGVTLGEMTVNPSKVTCRKCKNRRRDAEIAANVRERDAGIAELNAKIDAHAARCNAAAVEAAETLAPNYVELAELADEADRLLEAAKAAV